MAQQQREFDVEPVRADHAASPWDRAPDAVLDGVEVQGELLGGHRVTAPLHNPNAPLVFVRSKLATEGDDVNARLPRDIRRGWT